MFLIQPWDLALFELVNQQWRCRVLDTLMPLVSSPALLWGAAILLLLALIPRCGALRVLFMSLAIIASVGLTDFCTNLGKEGVGRVRPLNSVAGAHFQEDGQWRQRPGDFLQEKKHGSSYPSGHAANSMALAMALALLLPRSRPWVFILPLVVGYSRLYLGKHFPTDVLAGWVVGMFAASLLWGVCMAWCPKNWRRALPWPR